MEKRIIILEVQAEQTKKSIDRLDRSIEALTIMVDRRFTELDKKLDKKFMWCVTTQSAALIAIIGLLARMANIL